MSRPHAKEAAMSIPSRLSSYLDERGLRYEDCAGCLMARVPADCRLLLGEAPYRLARRELHLSDEQRIATLFADCDLGAVPPVGMAWGMEMIVDDELEASDVIYFEAGDHQSLVRMSREHFHELMKTVPHGHIAKATVH